MNNEIKDTKVLIKGRCCCGAVKFQILDIPNMMGVCHCSRCRKVGASQIVFVKRESFELLSGADNISTYIPKLPYKYKRCFCNTCGTSLGEITSDEDVFPVAVVTLDSDPILRNQFEEFKHEQPEWSLV